MFFGKPGGLTIAISLNFYFFCGRVGRKGGKNIIRHVKFLPCGERGTISKEYTNYCLCVSLFYSTVATFILKLEARSVLAAHHMANPVFYHYESMRLFKLMLTFSCQVEGKCCPNSYFNMQMNLLIYKNQDGIWICIYFQETKQEGDFLSVISRAPSRNSGLGGVWNGWIPKTDPWS